MRLLAHFMRETAIDMFSRKKEQDSTPDTPYDQLPYTYYADKLLAKSTNIFGIAREDAVEALAEAMEGMDRADLRLFELKGVVVEEGVSGAFRRSEEEGGERRGETQGKTIRLNKNDIRVFPHEAIHEFAFLMLSESERRESFKFSKNIVSKTVADEFQQQKKLYDAAQKNGEDQFQHAMNEYAMENAIEFEAEVARGASGVHDLLYDPPDKKGEALRQYAMQRGPKTVGRYDAYRKALRTALGKNQNEINLRTVRWSAKTTLATSKFKSTFEVGMSAKTTPLQSENSKAAGPERVSTLGEGKGKKKDTGRSERFSLLAKEDERASEVYRQNRVGQLSGRIATLVKLGKYDKALEVLDKADVATEAAIRASANPDPGLFGIQVSNQLGRTRAFLGKNDYNRALEAANGALARFKALPPRCFRPPDVRKEIGDLRVDALKGLGRDGEAETRGASSSEEERPLRATESSRGRNPAQDDRISPATPRVSPVRGGRR